MSFTVTQLSTGYSGSRVLNEVSLEIAPGEIVALLGRNGMGKSTLARTLAGSHPVESGQVEISGRQVTGSTARRRFQLGLRSMRQEKPVIAGLSVRENLKIAGTTVEDAAAHFAFLTDRADQDAGTLSGGEQKMLALARLAGNPGKFWVLDEPTEGLQPANVHRSGEIVRDAASQGCGVLLIEQHLSLAMSVASRWVVLEKGTIVDQGEVDDDALKRVTARLTV